MTKQYNGRINSKHQLTWCVLLFICMQETSTQVIRLPNLSIDPTKVSVSGISSGAAMATQFHFAHSSEIFGAGIFAGVPYMCGYGGLTAAYTCMDLPGIVNVPWLIAEANTVELAGNIDSTANIRGSKVYIFHGTKDTTVRPGSGQNIQQMYSHYGASLHTEFTIPAEHGQPTDNYGAACDSYSESHGFINSCGYNGAFEMLNYLHGGSLSRPNSTTQLQGDLQLFDQSEFFSYPPSISSMDTAGFLYVPDSCKSGVQCALHVVFHGCKQYRHSLGDLFPTKTGYLEVADLNDIVLIFPQTIPILSNPNGCWDWCNKSGKSGSCDIPYDTAHSEWIAESCNVIILPEEEIYHCVVVYISNYYPRLLLYSNIN